MRKVWQGVICGRSGRFRAADEPLREKASIWRGGRILGFGLSAVVDVGPSTISPV